MREQSEVNPVEVKNESKNDSKIESELNKKLVLYFVRMEFLNAEHLFLILKMEFKGPLKIDLSRSLYKYFIYQDISNFKIVNFFYFTDYQHSIKKTPRFNCEFSFCGE